MSVVQVIIPLSRDDLVAQLRTLESRYQSQKPSIQRGVASLQLEIDDLKRQLDEKQSQLREQQREIQIGQRTMPADQMIALLTNDVKPNAQVYCRYGDLSDCTSSEVLNGLLTSATSGGYQFAVAPTAADVSKFLPPNAGGNGFVVASDDLLLGSSLPSTSTTSPSTLIYFF